MAENSKIEWTHHTINFWWGCEKVSPACAHCYAEGQAARFHPGLWGPDGTRRVRMVAATKEALRYERRAVAEGLRFRVFTNSMSDFFEARPDLILARLEALDVIRRTPHLDWLILTERPGHIMAALKECLVPSYKEERYDLNGWLEDWLSDNPPANVWLGTTVEDQERAHERIPLLLQAPAAVRFLSCEPLLGPVDLTYMDVENHPAAEHLGRLGAYQINALTGRNTDMARPCPDVPHLDWVIVGGESGPLARPMHPDWARGLREQCAKAGVPFVQAMG